MAFAFLIQAIEGMLLVGVINSVTRTFKVACSSHDSDRIGMNKLASLLITSASIFLGVVSVTLPEKASSQVIVDDPRAAKCNLIKNERLQKKCNAFKLIKARDEKLGIDGFRIEFSFDDLRVTYIAVINKNATSAEINGKTFVFYPIILQTFEQRGLKPKNSKPEGLCGIASDYSGVICQLSDNSAYAYTGNPIRAQQNTETPQGRADNSRRYTVQTNSHIDTGISVNPGDKIKVQATGRIRFGFIAGSGGPRGILFNPDYNYFVDIPHGQLIGRVRQFGAGEFDGWFPIGEGREFVARSQGVLEFAVNDNKPGDNGGRFRIEVTITPAK